MKYEIKQLYNTDAVVISDEEIEKDDFQLVPMLDKIELCTSENIHLSYMCYKVIATIFPYKIEGLPMIELPNFKSERKIDSCYNFNKEIGCVQSVCKCETELPNQEDTVEKLAIKSANDNFESGNSQWINGFIAGCKATQKQFSKDILKLLKDNDYDNEPVYELIIDYLQSLQKEQFPTSVELTEDLQIIKWYYK